MSHEEILPQVLGSDFGIVNDSECANLWKNQIFKSFTS